MALRGPAFPRSGVAAVRRWRARLRGSLSRVQLLWELDAVHQLLRVSLAPRSVRSLERLLVACRRATWPWTRRRLRRRMVPLLTTPQRERWREHGIGLRRYFGEFADIRDRVVTTSLVLKAPMGEEKGVLYSSFEYNWLRIARSPGAREFFRDYYLVGASSWSPPDYASFVHLAGLSADPVFIGVSNRADLEAYAMAAPVIEPLPLMACDWINPDLYRPRPRDERSIDVLMVANWMPFKRHWLLFQALRRMRRDLRVVLVGRSAPGRGEREIREEAEAFGVRQDLEVYSDLGIDRVTELQCDARISVLFSAREGSCVVPVECFFADTPVAMMHDGHVGSRAYINDSTGVLVRRRALASQLEGFLERHRSFEPRRWALENASCHSSSRKLNQYLSAYARKHGRPWSRDIAPMCWRPSPQLLRAEDERALEGVVARFADRYGFTLDAPPPRT